MTRYFLRILFCLFACSAFAEEDYEDLFLSAPEQFATSHLIGGVISPLSGQPVLSQTDMTVKGAESIRLSRVYVPPFIPDSFERQGWLLPKRHLHQYLAGYKGWQVFPHIRLEYNAVDQTYRVCDPSGATVDFSVTESKTTLASSSKGICNAVGDMPSGKYDLRNTRIQRLEQGKWVVVIAPEGTKRFYLKNSPRLYFLFKEVLLNGKVLRYHYDKANRLIRVESMDPKEQHIYASLDITGGCHFTSSTGVTTDYLYEIRRIQAKFTEIENGIKVNKKIDKAGPPILTSVKSPSYRHEEMQYKDNYLLNSFSGKDDIFIPEYAGFGNERGSKVVKLSRPVGLNDAFEQVYEISYSTDKGTIAKDFEGDTTEYQYGKNRLIKSIKCGSKEQFYTWDDNHWLTSYAVEGLYKKSFEYDAYGNPIKETLTGDLTGSGLEESNVINREFSQDGKHLLIKEEHDNGKGYYYTYLPDTNLVTSKITKEDGRIILQEFSSYDACNNLVKTIYDDGGGQRIKTWTLRQQAPFFHMPEWLEESDGVRKHFIYDAHGNIAKEEIYDANGVFAYAIEKTYNERGDLLFETNALGQKASYQYDARGHRIHEANFSNLLSTTRSYDKNGRLKQENENSHIKKFEYDSLDRLIQETDRFNHVTHYFYDPITKKVSLTVFPDAVKTRNTYDPFGRVSSETDANGNVTTYRYNAYGDVTEANYPDGGQEKWLYAKDGSLISHQTKDGLEIKYKRDILGRVLSKTSLGEEVFTYNASNLLTKTDLEGNITQYTYDSVGRKIKEDHAGHVTEYVYDPLGRIEKVIKQNTLLIHYKRDLLDRIVSETKSDAFEISYSYDVDGNKASVTRNINGNQAIERFSYDPFGRLIRHVDPLNHITSIVYGEAQNQKTSMDPHGVTTIESKDAFNRVIKKEVLNSKGVTLSLSESVYDPHGNVSLQKDHVYVNGQFQNIQIIKRTFTVTHQVEDLIKGYGSKDVNITSFTYYPSGKLKTKSLPNGIALSYAYNPLGHLTSLKSSDGQIAHTFEYNLLGDLTSAKDQNTTIERKVDPFGNVLEEKLPQYSLKKSYDAFNRLTSLKISGNGEVHYEYDPLYLRQVKRVKENGQTYTHHYDAYDLNGNLTSETLIGELGAIGHTTNLNGQKSSITSPFFNQECSYDAVGNLIQCASNNYAYDDLSQLISEKDNQYTYDSLYNRRTKNQETIPINDLNQTASHAYDLNGNQTAIGDFTLVYDALNSLIEAHSSDKSIIFTYDPLGRCLSKVSGDDKEYYIHHGDREIGALDSNLKPKNFKVLGVNMLPLAIELDDDVYAPILDVQGNVRQLIDIQTKALTHQYEYTAFGESLQVAESTFNPWRFASKRFNTDLQIINFGSRFYSPNSAKWISQDPEGFIDSSNLYQYVYNNPFKYRDSNGKMAQLVVAIPLFFWGSTITLPALTAIITPIVYGTYAAAIVAGSYFVYDKITEVYAPDRELPTTEHGVAVPDEDAEGAHTQLGTKTSQRRKEKYPKAREFDENGNVVKDIEFTDHDRPHDHTCPHQHRKLENETGGTRKRDNQEPVDYWKYN